LPAQAIEPVSAPQIILIRHGPVALKASGLLSFEDFCRFVEQYEAAGLCKGAPPPALTEALGAVERVLVSDARRAVESAQALGLEDRADIDPVFREEPNVAPQVFGRWPLIVWFSLSRGAEAFHPARGSARGAMTLRAQAAARLLIDVAKDGPAALVGHGWFNRAISRALAENGWRRARSHGGPSSLGRVSAPWGHVIFER
jgi:broad specificity phosphatase PhoE